MKIISTVATNIATCGFVGKSPFAPGTFGSIPGILFYFLWPQIGSLASVVCIIGLTLLAVWSAGKAEQLLKVKDPGCIVIDEVTGMAVTFFALPVNLYLAIAGFAVFRAFDILKPFPVGYLDRNLRGGVGIVMDDVAAGVLSNLTLRMLIYAWHWMH